MQETIETQIAPDIRVTPLSAACGAEISGVDLSKPLSERQFRAIKKAWEKHLVLVFRGQQVSQDDQLRFASHFGDLGSRKKAPEPLRARAEGGDQYQSGWSADRRLRRR
jgi:alpha-ketoglutarate-dependent taurine dioxygenase